MPNVLPQDKFDLVMQGVLANMSLREIVKATGVAKQTIMKIKRREHPERPFGGWKNPQEGIGERKVQRKRPAGWHGSHGDHDPQYFTRETIRAMDYDDFEVEDTDAED